jgi:tetratricopeptide (TPR) repeat protein
MVFNELSKNKEHINKSVVKDSFKELTLFKSKTLKAKSSHLAKGDPLVKNSLDNIDRTFKKASELFNVGNIQGSKQFMSASIAQCVACHRNGGSNTKMGAMVSLFEFENPVFKARLLLAMRDYKAAKKEYKDVLNQSKERSEVLTNKLIGEYTSVLLSSSTSRKLEKRLSSLWRHNIKGINKKTSAEIKKFVNKYNDKVDLNNTFSKLGFAETLMSNYENPELMYTQEFQFLKAVLTYIYHSEMKNLDTKKQKAKAYYTLGKIYSNGSFIDQFLLPESYFESCIRTQPHSKLARVCYKDIENRITLGWTGSSGTKVPHEEIKRLARLKILASGK